MLRDVLAQDPNMSDALLWLGNSLNAQGRDDDALAVLQRAVRIDPLPALAKEQSLRGIEHHYSTALSYALVGDGRAAQFWLDRTIRDSAVPDDPIGQNGVRHFSPAKRV